VPPLASPLDEYTLVPYFMNEVMPRYCLGSFAASLDLDVLFRNEALHGAMLAISRAHHYMRGKHGSPLARNRSRQTAIQTFRKQLALGVYGHVAAQDLFSTNVLFCILDGMIAPTEEANASMVHLKGGFAILSQWESIVPSMLQEGGIRTHLLSVFATIDVAHAILSGRRPHLKPAIFRDMGNTDTWWGRLSPDAAILVAAEGWCRLAVLGSVVHADVQRDGLARTRRRIVEVEMTLHDASPQAYFHRSEGWRDNIDHHHHDHHAPGEMDGWKAFYALYDISARIFYERAIRLKAVDDTTVQTYTKQAVVMLRGHLLSGMLQHCVLLPTLIVGAHCIDVPDQKAIASALSPTVSYLSFGCLLVLEQFLQTLWKERRLEATWWESFEAIAERIFLF
jgi:hypothetical protein